MVKRETRYFSDVSENKFVDILCKYLLLSLSGSFGAVPHTRSQVQGDQRGGMHTNERLHVKLITIGSNGPYGRR